MKIAILTNHLLLASKQANIHYIYTLLSKDNNVDWYTYPLSISIFRKKNRYRLLALYKGWKKQYHIFNIIPKYVYNHKILRFLFSRDIFNYSLKKVEYDILVVEGIQGSYFYSKFSYKKLIIRMSDDLGYLSFFSDEEKMFKSMTDKSYQVWTVLLSTSKKYTNAIYLPNPSLHSTINRRKDRLCEVVYVGSNKVDNHLLLKLANSAIKVHMYSEDCSVKHDNILLHEMVAKEELVNIISRYKVGIIPFLTDDKNKYMEIPLKTYDYISAGLHVVMITSSQYIDRDVINITSTHDEFIQLVRSLMSIEINYDAYDKKLKNRSMEWFESKVTTLINCR
jgi:hypothetical protein